MKNRLLMILCISFFGTALIPAAAGIGAIRHFRGPGQPSTYRAAWEHVHKTRNGIASSAEETQAFGILRQTYRNQELEGPVYIAAFKKSLVDDDSREPDVTAEQGRELFENLASV